MPHVEQELLTLQEHMYEFASVFTYLIGVCVFQVVKLHVFTFLVPCCDVCYDFRVKTMFDSSYLPVCFVRGSFIFMLFVFMFENWCPTGFPYQMMSVSFNSNTTGVT